MDSRGDWMVPFVAMVVVGVLFMLVSLCGIFWNSYICESKWKASGMKSEYSVINGCMLEVTPGKWIPSDRYRSVD